MRRPRLFFKPVVLALVLVQGLFALSFDRGPRPTAELDLVVIDPGHGGEDPGAIGVSKTREKDVTLQLSLKLAELIKNNKNGLNVMLTRKEDKFVGLMERAQLANRNNAKLFLSIHCNSSKSREAQGTESFAMGVHKNAGNLEVMKRENGVILMEEGHEAKYDGFDPNSEEALIMFKLQQHAFLKQSLELASSIEKNMQQHAKRLSRGVKQAGFLVLWKTSMPSVLVEAGFLSHPDDEKFLKSAEGQDYLAKALYQAVLDFMDGRSS